MPPSSSSPTGPWKWQTLVKLPLDGSIVPVYDGKHLVTSTDFVAGGTDLTVKDAGTGRVVKRYDTPAGYAVQGVWLSGRWMVVEETEYEPKTYAVHLYRFDLQTGTVVKLHEKASVPKATEPDMTVSGDVLAYVGDDPAGRQCMHRLTVSTLAVQKAGCVPKGTVLGDPALGPDNSVTYSQVDGANTGKRCKRLLHWPAGPAAPAAVAGVRSCAQWSGAQLAGGALWSEVVPGQEDIAYAHAYARAADGKRTDLGLIVTGTIEPCAGWIYWKAPANHKPGGREAIYRWRPGTAPETVHPAAQPETVLSPPHCTGTYLTLRLDTLQPPSSTAQAHPAS